MSVQVRYFAAASAAAGVEQETVEAGTLGEIIARIGDKHGQLMQKVLPACSFLVDGHSTTDRAAQVAPGSGIDVLPPFAGG